MFEINIDNNSARISLARAAQLTGYHQDYLGQLCRLGKLPATKVGRNWFTSADALNSLSQQEQMMDLEPDQLTVAQPVITQNVTVSHVDGFPITIQTIPAPLRNTNTVESILTNKRIEGLQAEVTELRQLLVRLMEEVKAHAGILQSREILSRAQDSLKHSYISNFDFGIPESKMAEPRTVVFQRLETTQRPEEIIWKQGLSRKYELADWLSAFAVVGILMFIGFGIVSNNFFGKQTETYSVYFRPVDRGSSPVFFVDQQSQPEVAGVETSENSETLPTDNTGELMPNMIQ